MNRRNEARDGSRLWLPLFAVRLPQNCRQSRLIRLAIVGAITASAGGAADFHGREHPPALLPEPLLSGRLAMVRWRALISLILAMREALQ